MVVSTPTNLIDDKPQVCAVSAEIESLRTTIANVGFGKRLAADSNVSAWSYFVEDLQHARIDLVE
jgi:hypothetical protein